MFRGAACFDIWGLNYTYAEALVLGFGSLIIKHPIYFFPINSLSVDPSLCLSSSVGRFPIQTVNKVPVLGDKRTDWGHEIGLSRK